MASFTLPDHIAEERQKAADLHRLETIAQHGDHERFLSLWNTIDWANYVAAEISQAIDLALSLDIGASAAHLAQLGVKQFPDDLRLVQAARVLTPSAIRIAPSNQPGRLQALQDWLHFHANPYRGQWVVVRAGHLLGAAPELAQLSEIITRENDPATTIITRVW